MIKRLLRWHGIAFGGVLAVVLLAFAAACFVSERMIKRRWAVPTATLAVPTDAVSIEAGRRLAIVRGCFGGCHGKEAAGVVVFEEPLRARLVGPNLTAAVARYSNAELSAIIRAGVRPDRRSTIVLPAEVFAGLTDAGLSRIIA